jgi:hypothetical protein
MTTTTLAVAAAAALSLAFAVPALAGTMIGAAAASFAYAQSAPLYRCAPLEKYDAWGNYIGTRRVCRAYY